jgi:hypothetical protein
VHSRKRRINTYRVRARNPDSDAYSSTCGAVRTGARNAHIWIANQPEAERERAHDDRHQSRHQ